MEKPIKEKMEEKDKMTMKQKLITIGSILAILLVAGGVCFYLITHWHSKIQPEENNLNVAIVYYDNSIDTPGEWQNTTYRIINKTITVTESYGNSDSSWSAVLLDKDMYTIRKGIDYAASLEEDSTDEADIRYRVFSNEQLIYDGSYIIDDEPWVELLEVLEKYN